MDVAFNIDEIFEIAEQIERNGAIFYRAAAETTGDKEQSTKLLNLADMEDQHERTFAQMRRELVTESRRDSVYEGDDLAAQVLQAWASRAVFDMDQDPLAVLSPGISLEEILKVAIGREKESVVYYEGLKTGVSAEADREKVDFIIREEMAHIALLDEQLKQLTGGA